jgi:RND family efflux transporter MFP subunit
MKIYKLIVVLIAALSVFFYSCSKKGDGETKKNEEKKLTLVKFKQVVPSGFNDKFKISGTVKPYASAKVSSEVAGLIVSIPKDKGSYVSAGETVVHLKTDMDMATFNQSLAQIELLRVNFEKQKELYEDNATTELQYLNAKWQLEAAERGLDVLRTKMRTLSVRSPINGVIDDKFMNKGEMAAQGTPILSIIDVSRVKISAGVPESYVSKIKKGQHVIVTIDVIPGAEFDGEISYIAPALDQGSRTFEIELTISNRDRVLKPGMNANIEISQSEYSDAIVVPQDLIIDYGEEKFVYILDGDIAKKRDVTIGGREGNNVLIKSGLNAGDKLITEGFQSVKDNEKVQVAQ